MSTNFLVFWSDLTRERNRVPVYRLRDGRSHHYLQC